MPEPDQNIGLPAEAPFVDVSYLDMEAARTRQEGAANILGVVGFGTSRPDFLPLSCPFVAAPLRPVASSAMLEIWHTASACHAVKFGPVTGACSDHLAFGEITLDETGNASFEEVVEAAYIAIFDFLDASGFTSPIRFWNYLSKITQEEDGLDRYRRFNIGRHRAFSARLREDLPPAASGVGGNHGPSVIYFLAGHAPARPVENPRQVSAFSYPPLYGPKSPSFSRASVYRLGASSLLFISGTASITGHESRHDNDLRNQVAETIENLRAVIAAAGMSCAGNWAFKIYLHDPKDLDIVNQALIAAFGPGTQRVYLHGDVCRSELLVEIEAFRQT